MGIDLEKFRQSDFHYYFALVSDERVMAQITERSIPLEEAQGNFKALLERNKKYEDSGAYKIFDASTREYLGLGHITPDENKGGETEIGYMIVPEHWGKGYGTEIAGALITKAVAAGMTSLKAIIDPQNIPSRKILRRYGFHSEKVCEIGGLPAEVLYKVIEAQDS